MAIRGPAASPPPPLDCVASEVACAAAPEEVAVDLADDVLRVLVSLEGAGAEAVEVMKNVSGPEAEVPSWSLLLFGGWVTMDVETTGATGGGVVGSGFGVAG